MRFSDLKKTKEAARAPEPIKQASPLSEALRRIGAPESEPPPQPRPLPAQAEPLAPEAQPAAPSNIPEPVKQAHTGSPKSRREAMALARVPEAPFRDQDAKAREVYSWLLGQAGSFLKSVDQPYTEKYAAILGACRLVTETLRTNGILLNYTCFSTAEDYLRGHTANTTIIALAMGLEAGLDASELNLLGFCAMAHDIGMTEYSALYNRPERLNDNEFAEMSLHAEAGVAKLDRMVDLDHKVKARACHIVLQTHERTDGSGYPDRLSNEEIDPLAQLICIADAYEALSHPRAWRDAMSPPDAIKELVEKEGQGFNSKAVKALIAALSIYPPGSLVALASGEIARVIRVTRGFLTKPLVEILLDGEFSQVTPQLSDLFDHPLTSIERHVTPKEIESRNPKFAAKLELDRWWVDW